MTTDTDTTDTDKEDLVLVSRANFYGPVTLAKVLGLARHIVNERDDTTVGSACAAAAETIAADYFGGLAPFVPSEHEIVALGHAAEEWFDPWIISESGIKAAGERAVEQITRLLEELRS